jgi:AraC family transcriptional regulator of adaptative response / DNA-3-methyladenine glycosylase II
LLRRGRTSEEAASLLKRLVSGLGTPVPGLAGGLTHTFPPARAITSAALLALGLPARDAAAVAVAALVADVAEGHDALGHGTGLAALEELPGLDPGLRHHLAFRLGHRAGFPSDDASLRAALAHLGLAADDGNRWRPWAALAAVHLMAYGDILRRGGLQPAGPGFEQKPARRRDRP